MVLDRVKQILSHLSLAPSAPNTSTTCPYLGLSYHIGPTNVPLKHVTLSELLHEQAALNGENEALVSAWQGIRWTYRELDERSDELARSFWALGVRTGDRMAIMAGNCGEYVLVFPRETELIKDVLCCRKDRSNLSCHQSCLYGGRARIGLTHSWYGHLRWH